MKEKKLPGKASGHAFTRALVVDIAPIRVNGISPGVVKSEASDSSVLCLYKLMMHQIVEQMLKEQSD